MTEFFQSIWNWIKEVNWIIALLAAIPLSIAANLLTPIVRDSLARRPEIRRAARLEELRSELNLITEYKRDPPTFYNATFASLFRVLVMLGLGGLLNSALFFAGTPFYLMAVMEAWKHMRILAKLREFDQFHEDMTVSIEDLEANAAESETEQA